MHQYESAKAGFGGQSNKLPIKHNPGLIPMKRKYYCNARFLKPGVTHESQVTPG